MLSGLEYHLLHFLDVCRVLAFDGSASAKVPVVPSASRIVCASSFTLAGDLLEVAIHLLMSVNVAIAAAFFEACAFISGVACNIAELAKGVQIFGMCQLGNAAYEGARGRVDLVDLFEFAMQEVHSSSFVMVILIFENSDKLLGTNGHARVISSKHLAAYVGIYEVTVS
jgi:hypothetical protein